MTRSLLAGLSLILFAIAVTPTGAQLSLSLLAPWLDSDGFLYKLLQGLNVFTLWYIAVLALGAAVVGRRTSWGTAAATLFGIYLVILVVTAAVTT